MTAPDPHPPACIWCGQTRWLTVEHLLPRSRGGRGHAENLAPACRACNRRRGSRPVAAVVRERLRAGDPVPAEPLLAALERLSRSPSAPHAAYGARQLALVRELLSAEHDGLGR